MFLSSVSYLTAPGVGLFFMISGALLLPIKTSTTVFLKKRFTKIVIPLLFWSIVSLTVNALVKEIPLSWKNVASLPFSVQANPTYWFLYTLTGLYLLSPILSCWLTKASRKELEFFLLLWGISLCYPILRCILDINTTETGILYYFTGYAGYFILGYYLRRFPTALPFKWIILSFILSLIVPAICKLKDVSVDFYSLFWYLSIFVVAQCVFWWKLITHLIPEQGCPSLNRLIIRLSKRTFGIYLVHFLLIRYLLWNVPFLQSINSYAFQSFVIVLFALILSLGLTYLLGLLPGARYIIGVSNSYDS